MVSGVGINCVALDYTDRSSQVRNCTQALHLEAVPQTDLMWRIGVEILDTGLHTF